MMERLRQLLRNYLPAARAVNGNDPTIPNRVRALKEHGIGVILDVGANVGQYATDCFNHGYTGRIISFEPLSSAYNELKLAADARNNWTALNFGLGDAVDVRTINVSKNSVSSSFLRMKESALTDIPEAKFARREKVLIKKLDDVWEDLKPSGNVFLKMDTQGFEKQVLAGAKNSLPLIKGIQIELSLVELYDGEPLYFEMLSYLYESGYRVFLLEPGYRKKLTGELLQFDAVLFRPAVAGSHTCLG